VKGDADSSSSEEESSDEEVQGLKRKAANA